MLRVTPTVLDCAVHPGELALPVAFPHPHHCPSTSIISLQELHLLSFAVRSTNRVRRFRPQSARLPPSSRDDRRFALSCQRVLFQSAWLHPVLLPMCRCVPHAIPRRSPPYRSPFGARPELRPQLRFPFPKSIYLAGRYTYLCIP